MAGQRFGEWTVLGYAGIQPHARGRNQCWRARCDCGTESVVQAAALSSGASKRCHKHRGERHGATAHNRVEPLYRLWATLKSRCNNPSDAQFYKYGWEGVQFCDRWAKSFTAFRDDVGPRPSTGYTLKRIDPAGDFEPGNVRWTIKKRKFVT